MEGPARIHAQAINDGERQPRFTRAVDRMFEVSRRVVDLAGVLENTASMFVGPEPKETTPVDQTSEKADIEGSFLSSIEDATEDTLDLLNRAEHHLERIRCEARF